MNKAPVPIPQASQTTPQRSFRLSSERAKRNESPFAKTCNCSTKRDSFLIDIDSDRLKKRIADYFDLDVSDDELARRYPVAMKSSSGFAVRDARSVRKAMLALGGPKEAGFVRFAYRPFDERWLYWDEGQGFLGRPSSNYRSQAFEGNLFIEARERDTKEDFSRGTLVRRLADNFGNGFSNFFPMQLREEGIGNGGKDTRRANLSATVQRYLDHLGLGAENLFHHVLAVLHDPKYRQANAGALRMGWPRIPLPGWPDGKAEGVTAVLAESVARGRELAALLDPETPVPGVTQAPFRPEIEAIGAAAAAAIATGGGYMKGGDFAVTAGWGHYGRDDAVMPGQGRAVERAFTPGERAVMGAALPALGKATFDIYLNANACWRNIPAAVWNYRLGGYRVLKKWLSYRESKVLGRPLRIEEVRHFTETARRIAAILCIVDLDE